MVSAEHASHHDYNDDDDSGSLYLFGGIGLFLAGILSWIIGNTFPSGESFAAPTGGPVPRRPEAPVLTSRPWILFQFFSSPSQAISGLRLGSWIPRSSHRPSHRHRRTTRNFLQAMVSE